MLQYAAKELSLNFKINCFKVFKILNIKASSGWLAKFKKRHNLIFKTMHGQSKSANIDGAKKFAEKLVFVNENYEPDCIYNCDETSLFYKR